MPQSIHTAGLLLSDPASGLEGVSFIPDSAETPKLAGRGGDAMLVKEKTFNRSMQISRVSSHRLRLTSLMLLPSCVRGLSSSTLTRSTSARLDLAAAAASTAEYSSSSGWGGRQESGEAGPGNESARTMKTTTMGRKRQWGEAIER